MRPSLFVGFSLTVLTANVQEIHFAPEERLDAIDAALTATRQELDRPGVLRTD